MPEIVIRVIVCNSVQRAAALLPLFDIENRSPIRNRPSLACFLDVEQPAWVFIGEWPQRRAGRRR